MGLRALLCALGLHEWMPWDLSRPLAQHRAQLNSELDEDKRQALRCEIASLSEAIAAGRPRYCPHCNTYVQGTKPIAFSTDNKTGRTQYRLMAEVDM